MDKIAIGDHLSDFTLSVEPILLASDWYSTYEFAMNDPSEATMNWLRAEGWAITTTYVYYDGLGNPHISIAYRRRAINPELVLNDLIESYTNSYNESRSINDQRYDDIISLYTATLDETEDELISLISDENNFETLVTAIITALPGEQSSHATDVDGFLDDWGDSERERINDQFDNLISSKQSEMIARGLYNSTTWDAVETGIERERADALTNLEDQITQRQLELKQTTYAQQVQVRSQVLAARDRLMTILHSQGLSRTQLRDRVVEAIANFAERRNDTAPSLADIGRLTTELGARPMGMRSGEWASN